MSGYKVSDYGLGTDKWAEMLETQEKQRKGFIGLSLTNYANANKPAIEAGSYLECIGALYGFSSEEAIPGDGTDTSINYIMFDPTPMTFAWTTTPPVWNGDKQGWYNAGETKRYIGKCYRDGASYTQKMVYSPFQGLSDKNGNEVVAMRMETKGNTTGSSLATMSEVDVDVTGFSWTPTAILTAQVAFGITAGTNLLGVACYGQGSAPRGYAISIGQELSIVSVTPGVNKVTVRLRNSTAVTLYYDNFIVTAVRAP